MRAVPRMVRKDLLRKIRSPLGLTTMLLFPVLFAGIIAVSFGGEGQVPRVHLLVENRDEGFLGNALMSAIDSNEMAEHFDVEIVGEEGRERIGRGDGSALLRIPADFTRMIIDGEPTRLELVRNPAQGIMPEVAEQVGGVLVEGLASAASVLRGPLDEIAQYTRSDSIRITDAAVAEIAVAVKGTVEGAEKFLSPVVIEFESIDLGAVAADEESGESSGTSSSPRQFDIFLFVFPGISVWALFMIGDIAMRDVAAEADAGTLHRMLCGPIRPWELILAKAGFTAVVSLLALALLTIVGAIVVDRPVNFFAYLLLSLALTLTVTGAGAAVYGAAGGQARGATIASVIYLTLGWAGGSFMSVSMLPGALQAIAPFSPFRWGARGYEILIAEGGGVADVLQSVLRLAGLGAALLALGCVLLSRRVRRGAAA